MNDLITFILLISIVKSQIIIFPFKTFTPNKLTHEIFMSELIDNRIYLELKVGTPPQIIPTLIKLNQIPFFLTSSLYNMNSIGFNASKSSTYTQDGNNTFSPKNYDYNHAFLGEDIISIKNISNKDFSLDRFHFFLANNLTENNTNISGEIGLNIMNAIFLNFINQLKDKKFIKDYIFSLKYNKEEEGEFHLGNYIHYYDNNFNGSDFKTLEVGLPQRAYIDNWELTFFKIILGTGNNTFTNYALLSYEFGLIYGASKYYKLIKEIFFDKLGKKCEIKKFRKNDFYYACDDDINLQNFPDLIFVKYEINFIFTKNELFRKFDGKYYFLIVFSEEEKEEWILGKIFFKKYIISFNPNEKIIGFYTNFKNKDKNNDIKHNKFSISLSWILVILLFILLTITIIYIIYYLNIKTRKKRANELEDNYDYIAQKNNNDFLSINN